MNRLTLLRNGIDLALMKEGRFMSPRELLESLKEQKIVGEKETVKSLGLRRILAEHYFIEPNSKPPFKFYIYRKL